MNENIQKDYFALEMKWLKFIGISMKQDEVWYKLYSYTVLAAMVSLSLTMTHTIVANIHNVQIILEIVVFACGTYTAVLKVCVIFFNRKRLGNALQLLQSGVFIPNTERGGQEEDKLIKQCMLYANGQTMIICSLTVGNLLIGTIDSLIVRITHNDPSHWRLPYGGFELFNVTYSPNFDIVWTYQSITISYCAIAFSSIDVFMAGIMAYLSFQCKNLGNFIKGSIESSCEMMMHEEYDANNSILPTEPSNIKWKFLQVTLKEAIQYHMAIIDVSDVFENLFATVVLINFVGLSVIMCLAAFSATAIAVVNYQSTQHLLLTVAAAMLQLVTAYWGNEVKLQSLAIGKACYEINFIGSDIRFQRGLRQIIERTQTPIQFTVGKFAPLSLETFVTVMKTAYSYYMLLYNIILKKV